MRAWLIVIAGLVALLLLGAVVADGRDNTGEAVRASRWADDVCGSVGAWQGQLEGIGDELGLSSVAVRRHDGASGDSVEGAISVRDAVDRAVQATDDTLGEGLTRAGYPDVAQGEQAAGILTDWARQTENRLRAVSAALDESPDTTATAFAGLGGALLVLRNAERNGREAFAAVAELDPELGDAIEGERSCRKLMEDES